MALADYIEGLTIPQGRLAGEPFQLLSWQRRFLRGAFSQPGSAALSIARGNGKTTFLAAILAASVDVEGPLMQLNAEAVLVASSFEQARLAFAHVLRFLQPSIDLYGVGPRGRFRIEDSTARCRIQNKQTGASVKVLSSDPRRAHGSAPSLILMDELTQFPPSQLPAMLAALETSYGQDTRCKDAGNWHAPGQSRSSLRRDAKRRRGILSDSRGERERPAVSREDMAQG